MQIDQRLKRHRYPLSIISQAVWLYHRFERCWKIINEQVRNNRFFGSAQEFRHEIGHFFHETWPQIAWSLRDRVNDNFQQLQSVSSF